MTVVVVVTLLVVRESKNVGKSLEYSARIPLREQYRVSPLGAVSAALWQLDAAGRDWL